MLLCAIATRWRLFPSLLRCASICGLMLATRNDLLIGLPHSEIRWHKCHSLKLKIGFSFGISFIHSQSSAKNVEFHNPRPSQARKGGGANGGKNSRYSHTKLCAYVAPVFLFVVQLWNSMNCHRLVGISMPVRVMLSLHICCVSLCCASLLCQTPVLRPCSGCEHREESRELFLPICYYFQYLMCVALLPHCAFIEIWNDLRCKLFTLCVCSLILNYSFAIFRASFIFFDCVHCVKLPYACVRVLCGMSRMCMTDPGENQRKISREQGGG